MPSFANYPSNSSIKMLYLGNSGAGKTGSLASLAAAGYNIRLLDLDNKALILRDYLYNPQSIYRRPRSNLWTAEQADTIASRLSYVTITEGYNIVGAKAVPKGDSWHRINQQLNNWRDADDNPGNISKWDSNDILVIDSLSRYCESAMNFQLSLSGRLDSGPSGGSSSGGNRSGGNDYTAAYSLIKAGLQLLKSSEIHCHVIIICHIVFMEQGTPQAVKRASKGFPQVYGRANISPEISQYFPHVILAESIGDHPNVRRTIWTNNHESVELINPAPLRVRESYSLETGLAEYFRDIQQPLPEEASMR